MKILDQVKKRFNVPFIGKMNPPFDSIHDALLEMHFDDKTFLYYAENSVYDCIRNSNKILSSN